MYSGDGEAKEGAAKPDHIYMDAMAFGMGCCCLQITFQATDIAEALRVYDALAPVAPIMVRNFVFGISWGCRVLCWQQADSFVVPRLLLSLLFRLLPLLIEATSPTSIVVGTSLLALLTIELQESEAWL